MSDLKLARILMIMNGTLSDIDSRESHRINQLAKIAYGNGWKFWSAAPSTDLKPGQDAVWLVRDHEFRRVVIDIANGSVIL